MKYISLFSGIESASVAWAPLGWTPLAFAEVDPFCCAVLAHHYPDVPNWGDVTRFEEWPDAAVDVLVGGSPCQSFSVAGLRAGLADPRGNLMLTFGAVARRYRPRWLVWENVPGVLSSNGGRDFGTFLGMLAELGYGFAYRVLDAQYVRTHGYARAVPQRRRRVFVVGHLGDWRRAAAVLFERESLSGHPAPRRTQGERTAGGAQNGAGECFDDPRRFDANGVHGGGDHGPIHPSLRPTNPAALTILPLLEVGARTGSSTDDPRAGIGIGADGDPSFTLQAGKQHGVVAPTLQANVGGNGNAGSGSEAIVVAPTLPARSTAGGGLGTDFDCDGGLIVPDISVTLTARDYKGPLPEADLSTVVAHALRADGFDASEDGTPLVAFDFQGGAQQDQVLTPDQVSPALTHASNDHAGHHQPKVAIAFRPTAGTHSVEANSEVSPSLKVGSGLGIPSPPAVAVSSIREDQRTGAVYEMPYTSALAGQGGKPGQGYQAVRHGMAVRRLTPTEAARLQGLPDSYLDITYRGKPAADGNKYRALGNAMACNCMRWLGMRIALVESLGGRPS